MSTTTVNPVKFSPPPANDWVVVRPRLRDRIDDLSAKYRVVWVLGSAGSGKTTAVAQAFEEDGVGWLTLDESDSTPGRLLAHLEASVSLALPDEVSVATDHLKVGVSHAEAARLLAERVSLLRRRAVLIVDELERIADSATSAVTLACFLRNLAPSVRVILISRKEVALQLGSALGVGGVGRLTESDLALTVEEATEIIDRLQRAGVEPETAVRSTGGWVAGVLFEAWRSPSHIEGDGGAADGLHSYLAVEIMESLSTVERRFLMSTSVLDSVTPHGAARLGIPDAASVYYGLRRQLLPMSVARDGGEIRYHPRFREFLLQLLDDHEDAMTVHRNHALMLEEQGRHDDATDAFLAAGDIGRAARSAEAAIPTALGRGDVLVVARWLGQLSPEEVERSPLLTRGALAVALDGEEWNRGSKLADRLLGMGSVEDAAVDLDATFAGMVGACYLHVGRPADARSVVKAVQRGPGRDVWQLALGLDDTDSSTHYRERPADRGDVVDGLLHRFDLMHGRLDRLIGGAPAPWAASRTSRLAALRAAGRLQDALSMLREFATPERSPALSRIRIELLADLGLADEAMAALDTARDVAQRSSRYCVQLHRLLEASLVLRLQADVLRAREALAAVRADPTARQHRRVVEQLPLWTGLADLIGHNDEAALENLRSAVTYMRTWDRLLLLPQAAVFLAEAEWRCGNEDESDRACDVALSAARSQGSMHLLLLALRQFPQVLSRRLDADTEQDSEWRRLGRAVLVHKPTTAAVRPPGAAVRVRDFGKGGLEIDGRPVSPGLTRSVELLSYLAAGDGSCERTAVLREVFDHHERESASAYLRQAVNKLRAVLPGDHLDLSPTSLRWLRGSLVSDAVEVEHTAADITCLCGEERLRRCQQVLDELPAGEYLDGSSSQWADGRRTRIARCIEELHLGAAEAAFDLGEYTAADHHLRELLERAPYREAVWRMAMRVSSALGHDDNVIDLFRSCSVRLAEIAVTPSRETTDLVSRLRR